MVANAGKHLHMEKPGGVDLADFEKLVEILKSKNLTFSTGYMYRFNPKIQEALAKVKNGELGEIYSVEAHMDCKHPAEVRQWLQNFPGGMMFFLGCHLIDLIYQIQGEPEEIIPFNCSTGYDEVIALSEGGVNVCIEVTGLGIGLIQALDCMKKWAELHFLGAHAVLILKLIIMARFTAEEYR